MSPTSGPGPGPAGPAQAPARSGEGTVDAVGATASSAGDPGGTDGPPSAVATGGPPPPSGLATDSASTCVGVETRAPAPPAAAGHGGSHSTSAVGTGSTPLPVVVETDEPPPAPAVATGCPEPPPVVVETATSLPAPAVATGSPEPPSGLASDGLAPRLAVGTEDGLPPSAGPRAVRWPAVSRLSGRAPLPVASLPSLLLAAAVTLGVVLRVRQFAGRRSLWLDEAELGLDVAARGLRGLLRPLAFNQAAAPGWLWLERVSTRVAGVDEYGLRLPQLLAGCALLVLTALLARRLLGPSLAWVPVLLAAVSPTLLDYSNEAKPYAVDAAVTALLLLLLVQMLAAPSRRALGIWAVASALAVFTSWAAIVTVTTGAVVLLAVAARTARKAVTPVTTALRPVAAAQLAWLAVLGLQYALVLRRVAGNAALRRYWSHGYPSGALDVVPWAAGALHRLLGDPLRLSVAPLAAVLVVLGAVLLVGVRGRLPVPVVLLVPAAVLAAVVQAYPLQQRAALFLVVPALLLLAAPLLLVRPALAAHRPARRRVSRSVTRRRTALATGAVLALVLVTARGAGSALATLPHVVTHTESRPVLARLGGLVRPGDGVFVDAYSEPAYAFYGGADGLPQATVVDVARRPLPCPDAATLRQRAPSGRVWLFLSDLPARGTQARRDAAYAARFERVGRVTTLLRAPRSVLAVGVDLGAPAAARPVVADPSACLVLVRPAAALRRP